MSTSSNKSPIKSGYVIYEHLGSYGIAHTDNIIKGRGVMIISDVVSNPNELIDELTSIKEINKY